MANRLRAASESSKELPWVTFFNVLSFLIKNYFLAALGLCCCAWALSSCRGWGLLSARGPPASRCDGVSCFGAQARGLAGLRSCGTQA